MLAVTGCFVAVLYLTGLRADRTIAEPVTRAWGSGGVSAPLEERSGHLSQIGFSPGSVNTGLYRGHSAWYWAHKFKARTRQLQAAHAHLHQTWRPTVQYALRLASAAFGVSYSDMRSVGDCESHLYPFARNGIYRGVFQEGPMFERHPIGQAGFNVFDPLPNALVAASTVAREGWSQWECRP